MNKIQLSLEPDGWYITFHEDMSKIPIRRDKTPFNQKVDLDKVLRAIGERNPYTIIDVLTCEKCAAPRSWKKELCSKCEPPKDDELDIFDKAW